MKNVHVYFVVDASGSMQSLERPTVDTLNGLVTGLQGREDCTTKVSLSFFNYRTTAHWRSIDADRLSPLTYTSYKPTGGTALYDAVGEAIEQLKSAPNAGDPDTSFLVIAITDGEENASNRWTAVRLYKEIERLEGADKSRWTITFQVPKGSKAALVGRLGIAEDNVREWEATREGMAELKAVTSASMASYYDGVRRGQANTRSFFQKVTTDLSAIDPQQIQKQLQDVSRHFKSYTVDKEVAVKSFVEVKTGKLYVTGQAYYQLMKTEEVQPNKAVLLVEKGKKKVFGGPAARQMIGLPDGQHAKVNPGNHANYDIFVQSTSFNRKLPRGTKVLVDVDQTKPMAPTWGTAP